MLKKLRKITPILLVLAMMLSVVVSPSVVHAGNGKDSLKLEKIATRVSGQNLFDVNLSVSGKDKHKKKHIAIIIDSSQSMTDIARKRKGVYSYRMDSKMELVKDSAKTFVSKLFSGKDSKKNIKVSLYDFNTVVNRHDFSWIGESYSRFYSSNPEEIKTEIDQIPAGGGTNIQDAIHIATQDLNAQGGDSEKVIVLLTDGMPTYSIPFKCQEVLLNHLCKNSHYIENLIRNNSDLYKSHRILHKEYNLYSVNSNIPQDIFDYGGSSGNGVRDELRYLFSDKVRSYTWNEYYVNHKVKTIAEGRYSREKGVKLFAVGVNKSVHEQSVSKSFLDKLTNNNAYLAFINGKENESLGAAYDKIATTLNFAAKDITITDPMGDMVSIPDADTKDINELVKLKDANGDEVKGAIITYDKASETLTVKLDNITQSKSPYILSYQVTIDNPTAKLGEYYYANKETTIEFKDTANIKKKQEFNLDKAKVIIEEDEANVYYLAVDHEGKLVDENGNHISVNDIHSKSISVKNVVLNNSNNKVTAEPEFTKNFVDYTLKPNFKARDINGLELTGASSPKIVNSFTEGLNQNVYYIYERKAEVDVKYFSSNEADAKVYTEKAAINQKYAVKDFANDELKAKGFESKPGYHFLYWRNKKDNTKINGNSIITPKAEIELVAEYAADTDTKYTVRHLIQDLNDANVYNEYQVTTESAETGETVTANPLDIPGYTLNPAISTVSQVLKGDGTTVLELKYDIDKSKTFTVNADKYFDGVKKDSKTLEVWAGSKHVPLESVKDLFKAEIVGYKFEKSIPNPFKIADKEYVKVSSGSTVSLFYLRDDSQTRELKILDTFEGVPKKDSIERVKKIWINTKTITLAEIKESYIGYKLKANTANIFDIPADLNTPITLVYEKDLSQTLKYKVEYLKSLDGNTYTVDPDLTEERTAWINDKTVNKTKIEKTLIGYKLKEIVPTPDAAGEIAISNNSLIQVKYIKDDSQTKTYKIKHNFKLSSNKEYIVEKDEALWINETNVDLDKVLLTGDKELTAQSGEKIKPSEFIFDKSVPNFVNVIRGKNKYRLIQLSKVDDKTKTIEIYYLYDDKNKFDLKFTIKDEDYKTKGEIEYLDSKGLVNHAKEKVYKLNKLQTFFKQHGSSPTVKVSKGYKFVAFVDDKDKPFDVSVKIDKNTVYTAKFEKDPIFWKNISYNGNGAANFPTGKDGKITMPDENVLIGSNHKLAKNKFIKPGYKFIAWEHSYLENGITKTVNYQDEELVKMPDNKLELKAIWEKDYSSGYGDVKFTIAEAKKHGAILSGDVDENGYVEFYLDLNKLFTEHFTETNEAGKIAVPKLRNEIKGITLLAYDPNYKNHASDKLVNYPSFEGQKDLSKAEFRRVSFVGKLGKDESQFVNFKFEAGLHGEFDDKNFDGIKSIHKTETWGSFAKPAITANDGYKFDKWEPEFASDKVVGTIPSTSTTIVAKYVKDNTLWKTVEYDGNGNTNTSVTMAKNEVLRGTSFKLSKNLFQKEGYAFDGWSVHNIDDGTLVAKYGKLTDEQVWTMPNYNVKLIANWVKDYSNGFGDVVFKAEKGKIYFEPAKPENTLLRYVKVNKTLDSSNVIKPKPVIKKDEVFSDFTPVFDGAKTPESYAEYRVFDKTIKVQGKDVIVKAKELVFNSSFERDDSKYREITFEDAENAKIIDNPGKQEVHVDDKWKDVKVPVVKPDHGYKQDGWTPKLPDNDTKIGDAFPDTKDRKKVFKPNIVKDKNLWHDLVYDGNGAINKDAMKSENRLSGTTKALQANKYRKPGYRFDGWSYVRIKNGVRTEEILADKIGFKMPNGPVILKAIWTKDYSDGYTDVNFKAGTNSYLKDKNGATTDLITFYVPKDKVLSTLGVTAPTAYASSGYDTPSWTPGIDLSKRADEYPSQYFREEKDANGKVVKRELDFTANVRLTPAPPAPKPVAPIIITKEPEVIIKEAPLPKAKLNYIDHFAYINGYPEGNVRPQALITREEASVIFFRLLDPEYRDSVRASRNKFTDVEQNKWSNKHISTLAKGQIILGYKDGTFKPRSNITRAELAVIASRFDRLALGVPHNFSDVKGHWAELYIASAVKKGWVKGYKDGSFKPNEYITRAEFVTLVNNVLGRHVKEKDILKGTKEFTDLKDKTTWYYTALKVATNSYLYAQKEGEKAAKYQKWTKLIFPVIEM